MMIILTETVMIKKKLIVVLMAVVLVIILVYLFPFQRFLALNKYKSYINAQGINADIISEKEIFKDWKNGGYLIAVKYSDDLNNKYYYHYYTFTNRKEESFKFNRMFLSIIDEENSVELEKPFNGKCKYPPIED